MIVLGVCCLVLPAAATGQNYRYSQIIVEGNSRIDSESVVRISELPASGSVSAADINSAFRRISDSQLFEELSIEPEGGRLVISVVEFPTINEISIEGNRRIKDDVLIEHVQSTPRHVYNPALAETDATTISEIYRVSGRYAATVAPKIIRRSDNRVDLVFEVFEGKVIETERISFIGNRVYSGSRLRRVLASKQAGLFRTFIRSDTYLSERLEVDKALLRDFYFRRGYLDFEVQSVTSELTVERDAFFLVFKIHEGQQYRFGRISAVTDMAGIDTEEYAGETRIVAGDIYTPRLVDETVGRMEFLAAKRDLPFVRVLAALKRHDAEQLVDITFRLVEGARVFVERIEIQGNTTTLDRVIRRQFELAEGDPFNARKIEEAETRIRYLGFFSTVEVTTEPGSTRNHVVVRVQVVEKPTGALSFGATYAKDEGLAGTVNLSESNLLGRGQFLSFGFVTGDDKSYSLTFVEPHFLDRPDVEFQLDTSYQSTESKILEITTTQWSFEPSVRFSISEDSRLRVGVGFSSYELGTVTSSSFIIAQDYARGDGDNLSFNYLLDYDSRRTSFNPRRGLMFRGGQRFTYGTHDKSTAIRTTALAGAHTTILNEDVTLSGELEAGVLMASGGPSRIRDRFHMHGGIMRGFANNGIGPRDFIVGEDTEGKIKKAYRASLGGNYFAALRLESRFPLGSSEDIGLSGGVFLDVGSVWGLDETRCADYKLNDGKVTEPKDYKSECVVDDKMHLRSAAGFSLFWTTALGPLRFNFSTDLQSEPYDTPQSFNLELASSF